MHERSWLIAGVVIAALGLESVACDTDGDGDGDGDADVSDGLCGLYGPEVLEGPYPLITEPHLDQWPIECRAEELPFVITAEPAPRDVGEYEAVTVTLEGGLLTSFDGLPCHYCDFHEPLAFDASLHACAQYFVCDEQGEPFRVYLQITNHSSGPEPYWALQSDLSPYRKWILGPAAVPRAESWTCTPNCDGRVCGSDGCGGTCGACEGEGETSACVGWQCWALGGDDGGAGDDYCDACLDGCQGLPSCCTGSGCICMDACMTRDCGDGFALCCGWDGFCFCSDSCPYW